MKRFIIRKPGNESDEVHAHCVDFIRSLPEDKAWTVEVKEYRKNRTSEQNRYLHAVPLKIICDYTGYDLDDMKTYLCGEWTGWQTYEIMGQKKKRPVKTTSEMTVDEMSRFIEWIPFWAARTLDLTIPLPGEGEA